MIAAPVSRQLEQYRGGDQRSLLQLLNQLRAGVNAQDQSYTSIYNVRDFGARGDGTADDGPAFQRAHDAMPTQGGLMWVPEGNYTIGSTVLMNKGITIEGAGCTVSTLYQPGGAAVPDVLYFVGTFQRVSNLGFNMLAAPVGVTAPAAGAFVRLGTVSSRFHCDNLLMLNFFRGFYVESIATAHFSDCQVYTAGSASARGWWILPPGGGGNDIVLQSCIYDGGGLNGSGLRLENCGECVIIASEFIRALSGMNVAPTTGQVVASLWVIDSKFDNCVSQGAALGPVGSGAIVRTKFSNCWFSSTSAGNGLNVAPAVNTATIGGVDISDCHAFLNSGYGMLLRQPGGAVNVLDVHVSGGEVAQNGIDGILFDNGINRFSALGVRSGNCGGLTGNTGFGIQVNTPASAGYRIQGCDTTGNTGGGLNDLGVGAKSVANNL